MANQEHLEILKQRVGMWHRWRREHPDVQPDLREADLSRANLTGIDFSFADLSFADLSEADLTAADLSGANLSYVNLNAAYLNSTILNGATFNGATLGGAQLLGSSLNGTNLSYARVWSATFGYVDLSVAKGLETVQNEGPSTIGIDTIYRSQGNIPEIFLKGAGVDDIFITYIRSLVGKAIEYYSCFISYSSKDEAFAKRLYADLQNQNVRCWFAPHDMRPGTVILRGIDEAIRMHDKLLLILSKDSVASKWVEHEVEAALYKEMGKESDVLFPIRIDNAVLESSAGWAVRLHHRHIGDFTHWKNHDDYQKAFARLIRDLKASS